MDVIIKTFQCWYRIVYLIVHLFVSKFQHNRHVQSIGIPFLNIGFHVKILTGDFPLINFLYMRVFNREISITSPIIELGRYFYFQNDRYDSLHIIYLYLILLFLIFRINVPFVMMACKCRSGMGIL